MADRQDEELAFRKFITELLQAQKYEFLEEQRLFSQEKLNETLTRLCKLIAEHVEADSCTIHLKLYDPKEFLSPSCPKERPKEDGAGKHLDVDLWDHVEKVRKRTHIIGREARAKAEAEAMKVFRREDWKAKASTLRFPYWKYPKGAARLVASNPGGPWEHLLRKRDGSLEPHIVSLESGITADIFQDNFAQIRDPLSIRASRNYRKLGGHDYEVWTNTNWRKSFKNFYGSPIRIHPSGEVLGILKVENKWDGDKSDQGPPEWLRGILNMTAKSAFAEKEDGLTAFEIAVLNCEKKYQKAKGYRHVSYLALAYLTQDLQTHWAALRRRLPAATVEHLLFIEYPRQQSGQARDRADELLACCGNRLVQMMPEPDEEKRLRILLGAGENGRASYSRVRGFHHKITTAIDALKIYDSPAKDSYPELPVEVASIPLKFKLDSRQPDDGSKLRPFFFSASVKAAELGDTDNITFPILAPPNPAEQESLDPTWISRGTTFTESPKELHSRLDKGQLDGWKRTGEWFEADDGKSFVLDLLVDRWAARVEALNYCVPVREFTADDTRKLCWAALEIGKLIEREVSYRANQSDDPIPLTAMEFYRIPISDLCFVDDMRERREEAAQVKVHLDHHVQHALNILHMSEAVKFTSRLKEHGSYLHRLGERYDGFIRGNLAIWFYLLSLVVTKEMKEASLEEKGVDQEWRKFIVALGHFGDAIAGLNPDDFKIKDPDTAVKFFQNRHGEIAGDARFSSPPFPHPGPRVGDVLSDLEKNLVDEGFLRKPGGDSYDREREDLIFRQFDAFAIAGASLLCQLTNLRNPAPGFGDFANFYEYCFRLRDFLATSQRDIVDTDDKRALRTVFDSDAHWGELLAYIDSNDTKGFLGALFPDKEQRGVQSRLPELNLNIRGIYKRLRHLNHTLRHQRGVAHLDWELRRVDLLGLRLNCLYKNQVFAAYEQLWNMGDPFWGMITQRGDGRLWKKADEFFDRRLNGRLRWLCLRTNIHEDEYYSLQVAALADPAAMAEGFWDRHGYNLRRAQAWLGEAFQHYHAADAAKYMSLARTRHHLRWEYGDWYEVAAAVVRTRSAESVDVDASQLGFGSFLGEAAVDLLLEWIAKYRHDKSKAGLTEAYKDIRADLSKILEFGRKYTEKILELLTAVEPGDQPLRVCGPWVRGLFAAMNGLYNVLEKVRVPVESDTDWRNIAMREHDHYKAKFKLSKARRTDGTQDWVQSLSPVIFVDKAVVDAGLAEVPENDGDFESWVDKLDKDLARLRRSQPEILFHDLALRKRENVLERIQNYVLLYREDSPFMTNLPGKVRREFLGWTASGLFYYLRSLVPVEVQIRTMLADTLAEQYHKAVYKGAPPQGTKFVRDRWSKIAGQLDDLDKEMEADFEDYIERRRVLDKIGTVDVLSERARAYVVQQFGKGLKWEAINSAIWSAIRGRKEHAITLTDVDEVAKTASAESTEVLAVLALLCRPASGLLEMQYFASDADGASTVAKEEVTRHLRSWWRGKTIDYDAWRAWAGKVIVKWSPVEVKGDSV